MVITKEIFDKYKKDNSDWRSYINGNYIVNINMKTGTKERIQPDDNEDFVPAFPESIDCNITEKCTGGCSYCYQMCTPDGKEANIKDAKFLDTLMPYTEIALQVNELDHPDLIWLLKKLKAKQVIANITVNQIHFIDKINLIRRLVNEGLINGIGISYIYYSTTFVELVKEFQNAVIHVINGIVTEKLIKPLYDKDLKLLILGYKNLGRGIEYGKLKNVFISDNQTWLYNNMINMISHFKVVSFDNLALEQLNIQRFLTKEKWDTFYMGDDGCYTFYIDLVNNKFGQSSLCKKEDMLPLKDDIVDMFNIIRNSQTIKEKV